MCRKGCSRDTDLVQWNNKEGNYYPSSNIYHATQFLENPMYFHKLTL